MDLIRTQENDLESCL